MRKDKVGISCNGKSAHLMKTDLRYLDTVALPLKLPTMI